MSLSTSWKLAMAAAIALSSIAGTASAQSQPANNPPKVTQSALPQKKGGTLGNLSDFLLPKTEKAEPGKAGAGKPAVKPGPEAIRFQRLWQAVLEFRGQSAIKGMPGWKRFASPKLQQRFNAMNKEIWGELDADDGWSYFFWLALFDVGRPLSKNPVVGFYHPWSDVWLFTHWQVDPQPQILDAEIIWGEWVRRRGKTPFAPNPDWLRREGFRAEQLARATVENIDQFDRLMAEGKPWWQALQVAEQEELFKKINYPMASLQLTTAFLRHGELATGDEQQPVLERVIAATGLFLKNGKAGKIGPLLESADGTKPEVAKLLRPLPPRVYEQLAPVYWLADQQRAAVFLVPETNPDFCLALAYDREASGLRLARVDLLHFPRLYALLQAKGVK